MKDIYRTGEPSKVTDFEFICKDGSIVTVELSAYLMRNKAGEPIGFRGVARDVSDKFTAEAEKNRLEIQLQQFSPGWKNGSACQGKCSKFMRILEDRRVQGILGGGIDEEGGSYEDSVAGAAFGNGIDDGRCTLRWGCAGFR